MNEEPISIVENIIKWKGLIKENKENAGISHVYTLHVCEDSMIKIAVLRQQNPDSTKECTSENMLIKSIFPTSAYAINVRFHGIPLPWERGPGLVPNSVVPRHNARGTINQWSNTINCWCGIECINFYWVLILH